MSAYLYLVAKSAKNRFAVTARRARSPRYAAALLIGGLYIWSFVVRPASRAGTMSFLLGQPTEMLVTLLAAITLMGSWLFGSDATALAFTQAEVSMLFSAPVSRRSLIVYKLARVQVTVMINALIWVFVLRRGGALLPSPFRAVSLWVMFSTLNLHRLGAALVRSSWREHGRSGTRRQLVSGLVFGAVGASLVWAIVVSHTELLKARGADAFFTALSGVMSRPPASWGLFPFHLVIAPAFARTIREWSSLIWPAVLVMFAHAWWVLRSDAAFEDAAIEASAERARRQFARSTRTFAASGPPRPVTATIKLAASGHPGLAIVWKNMLCLRRTAQLRLLIGPIAISIATGAALSEGRSDAVQLFATSTLTLAASLLLFGGRLIRNDLRQDMQNLPLLKTLPVDPTQIVLAEVASSALPIGAIQLLLVIAAYVAMLASTSVQLGTPAVRAAALIAAPFVLAAVNGALLTIQNGMAVLFPTLIRLGPAVSTGVEALGQNVLASAANLTALGLAMIVPALLGWGVLHLLGEDRAPVLVLSMILASLVLAAETYGAMRLLGGALARAEPAQTQ